MKPAAARLLLRPEAREDRYGVEPVEYASWLGVLNGSSGFPEGSYHSDCGMDWSRLVVPALMRAGKVLYMACGMVGLDAAVPNERSGAEGVPGAMSANPRPPMRCADGRDCRPRWLTP